MLTRPQLDILQVLWAAGEATVLEVQEALEPRRAPSTVATMLSRLEGKGLVRHRRQGRQYVYRAAVARSQVRRSMLSRLADLGDRLFGGDVPELIAQLVEVAEVAPEDLPRIRRMLEDKERALAEGEPPKETP